MAERFAGIVLRDEQISYRGNGGSVAGAVARVETDGEVVRRFSVTRLAVFGHLGFGMRKKKDRRECYVVVEGRDFAFVAEADPNKGADARRFAALINQASRQASGREQFRDEARSSASSWAALPLDMTPGDVPVVVTATKYGSDAVAVAYLNRALPLPASDRREIVARLRAGVPVDLARLTSAGAVLLVTRLEGAGFTCGEPAAGDQRQHP